VIARAGSDVLRAENRRLLAGDVAARRAVPTSLPSTVRIETTTECRLACLHCFKQQDSSGSVMSKELYDRLARELFSRIDTVELGFGGEPLHDPHLEHRLTAIDPDRGPRIDLTTSGDGLESWIGWLAPRARRVTISVETLDAELYPVVRKGARLQTLLRAVERFRLATEAVPAHRRPIIAFRITLFGGNHAILPGLIARLAAAGANEVFLHHGIALPDSHADLRITDRAMDLGVALQRAVLQGQVADVDVHYPKISPRPPWKPEDVGRRRDGGLPDDARWTRASVAPDGAVAFCCPGNRLDGAPTVSMNDSTFREAWTSTTMRDLRTAAGSLPCCGWCPHGEEATHG